MYGITCLRQTMNGSTLGLVHDFLIVRAFDGIESTPEGFEARSAGFPEHVTLESLPDRLPDVLSFMGTNVVPTTRLTMIIRNDRKAEFGWSKDFMNGIERYCSRLPFRHVPCLPPRLRLTHALQTPESCPERRIVERASELKRLFEKTILLIVHTKRKFDNVGRGGGAHKAMLLHVRKLCAPYPLIE